MISKRIFLFSRLTPALKRLKGIIFINVEFNVVTL